MNRLPSIPLISQDPMISIWSPADRAYEAQTAHWSGLELPIKGEVVLKGETCRFMGAGEEKTLTQTDLKVTATSTFYTFEGEGVTLKVRFSQPAFLEDPVQVSVPVTYIDTELTGEEDAFVRFVFSKKLVTSTDKKVVGFTEDRKNYKVSFMTNVQSAPLSYSGDNCTIDWGTLYIASGDEKACISYDNETITAEVKAGRGSLVFAYDDDYSIRYFDEMLKGLWTERYENIFAAVEDSIAKHGEWIEKCDETDAKIAAMAVKAGGEELKTILEAAYRQTICAHKLVKDKNGDLLFLSKENDSNGCIATVDVSYPSIPLYLLFNTEYVKGMMRPIFKFAACDVWEFDFAPHDAGRYPFATGQVYGLDPEKRNAAFSGAQGHIYEPTYLYAGGNHWFDLRYQMPVEECGNMLLMCALVSRIDGNADFVKEHEEVLEKWCQYLLTYGKDPGEQLCTDDFAGHLAHNANLSLKAINGIKGFAYIEKMLGRKDKAKELFEKAKDMAKAWKELADAGDHTVLAYGQEETWSLKYNMIMDALVGGERLFSQEEMEKEVASYIPRNNEFGVPLDSRKDYTKSDWILWCCGMTKDMEKRRALTAPMVKFLEETPSRYPFTDWYDTVKGTIMAFKGRSVQGGLFMPVLRDMLDEKFAD